MPGTEIYIDDTLIDLAEIDAWPDRLDLRLEGISTLTLGRRGGPLPALPDPLLNKSVKVKYDDVLIYQGDIMDSQTEFTAQGYGTSYQARCLRNRGDQIPFIDSNTLTCTANYNYPANSEYYFASRSGRTVGQILQDCLEMATVAGPLHDLGIGNYTVAGGEYSLPASTLADLALLTQIPTGVCTVSGQRCLSAPESFLQSIYPGHVFNVQPDGTIRVFDTLDPAAVTLTLEDLTDLASPPNIRRSLSDCYTRVRIVGQPKTVAKLLSLKNGGLEEWFQYGSVSSADAKAAWYPEVFKYGQGSRSTGTCTITDVTHVVVTSADPLQEWDADAFDQAHQQGVLHLSASVISGVDSIQSVRVVANTALTAGGTSTLTLESALPATDYDSYTLMGYDTGPALVYRRYRIVDADMRHALARQFNPSAIWVGAYGGSATATNFPMASVCWNPYNEVTDGFALDIADGTITFYQPTFITANGSEPSDVRVLIALNEASLTAVAPSSGYEGTAYDIDGVEREKTIFLKSWTDPVNQAAMDEFAQQTLDACKNAVVDLSLTVNRILPEMLPLANQGLNVEAPYTTYLETANLPVSNLSIVWNNGSPSHHTTNVTASNRRQPPGENILPPERQRQGNYLWGSTQGGNLNPYDLNDKTAGTAGDAKP